MGVLCRNGADARFLKANSASAAQLGRKTDEMAGRSALELGLPPALVEGWLMALEAAHQAGKPLDVRWQLSTGYGLRTFTTRLLPFADGGRSEQHFGYINQDWTAAQDVHLGDAVERERLAGALASALAEEVEAPLEQLLGLIGVVADEVGALADLDPTLELEECGRVLASAMLLARRAHAPVHELREFLRSVPYSPGPVEAAECMRSALRLVSSEVKRSCGVRTEILPAAFVQADEPRLRHALIRTLLETARGPGPALARVGELVVSMTRETSVLELVITRADGCGTPQGDLATCERLVREAGGLLRVERRLGAGFRVRVALPLVQLG
jgi:signal transduction histidine kinase